MASSNPPTALPVGTSHAVVTDVVVPSGGNVGSCTVVARAFSVMLLADVPSQQPLAFFAAFAMAVFFRGMSREEAVGLTLAMRDSGTVLQWDLPGPVVDKHSSGGIGDNLSLMLAPMLAACGCYVPMISGRGLGHTGGTLDKLDSIPGFRTDLSLREIESIVEQVEPFRGIASDVDARERGERIGLPARAGDRRRALGPRPDLGEHPRVGGHAEVPLEDVRHPVVACQKWKCCGN